MYMSSLFPDLSNFESIEFQAVRTFLAIVTPTFTVKQVKHCYT